MRGRFAPSPTGDLHLGGARTALTAWLAARAAGGEFIVRVEDLDRPRAVAGAEARIVDDLRWLGLDWDGPICRQSERLPLYEAAVERLLSSGAAFPCFCSRAEVARAAHAPHGPEDDGPRYPGTCRALTAEQVAEQSARRKPSLRVRVEPGAIDWSDGVHGPQHDHPSLQVGDFVIRRADGIFAYQLAVVVDDAAQGISDVVRGDDLLSSTARQICLYRALGFTPPRFAHVPLIVGADGQRLSKRHGDIRVRAAGISPLQIVGRLAATLGLCAPGDELTPRDLVDRFSFAQLPKTPTVLDQI